MAGQKGRSGGARKNAGRKLNPPLQAQPFSDIEEVHGIMQSSDSPLVMPEEIQCIGGAAKAWNEVLELDKNSKYHLLNNRHKEALKSYCISVAIRDRLIQTWHNEGEAVTYIDFKGNLKISPVAEELKKISQTINKFADDLGLTVLSEYRMAREAKTGESLMGEQEQKDDMFE